MNVSFLFTRGHTVTAVAAAAEVDSGTASKWKSGKQGADWPRVCKLYANGLITDADLRRNGLAVPLGTPAPASTPEAATSTPDAGEAA